jgi:hypothetical protein
METKQIQNLYANDIHTEMNEYSDKCFDILQHEERIQKFKEIYKKKF